VCRWKNFCLDSAKTALRAVNSIRYRSGPEPRSRRIDSGREAVILQGIQASGYDILRCWALWFQFERRSILDCRLAYGGHGATPKRASFSGKPALPRATLTMPVSPMPLLPGQRFFPESGRRASAA